MCRTTLLFEANDLLLDKFDALVRIVRLNQPAFYAAYWNNRKVISKGNSSLVLTATITDAATREGIIISPPSQTTVVLLTTNAEGWLLSSTSRANRHRKSILNGQI